MNHKIALVEFLNEDPFFLKLFPSYFYLFIFYKKFNGIPNFFWSKFEGPPPHPPTDPENKKQQQQQKP